jgi:hypothetical protein
MQDLMFLEEEDVRFLLKMRFMGWEREENDEF